MIENDTKRLSRLIALLTLLQSKKVITATYIAKKFNVSVRTVYRDIRALEEAGVPIGVEDGKGYSIVEEFRLPPIIFSEREANAMITAEQIILRNTDASLIQDYSDAITKIKAVLRSSTKGKSELLSSRVVYAQNFERNITSNYVSIIQLALTDFLVIKLAYSSSENNATSRDVEPFALFYSPDEKWILVAWCRLRNDFRLFRLDRIQSLEVSTEKFTPHKVDFEELMTLRRNEKS